MSQRQEFQGVAESSGRSKSAIFAKGTFGRKDEVSYKNQGVQGVAESVGRSKSAIFAKGTFGRKDEVSYENVKYSGEAKPEYFTDSRAEPTPKRRGRKPKRTIETFKSELKESKICGGEAVVNSYEIPEIRLQTFHFHFSEELVERFTYFATLHRFDERKAYKENWIKWIAEDDVNECIATEVERLTSDGYTGDILDKMFKSVRYYYRKKPLEPLPPKIRKSYESFPQDVLQRIDAHILDQIRNHANSDELRSPSPKGDKFPRIPSASRPEYFTIFAKGTFDRRDEVSYENSGETKSRMKMKNPLISPAKAFANYKVVHESEITAQTEPKYKKTYKNRFFLFTKHIVKYSGREAVGVRGNLSPFGLRERSS